MFKSLLSAALTFGLLVAAASPAAAFRPGSRPGTMRPMPPQQQPAAFAGLAGLDASTCSALEQMMSSPEVIKNFKAAKKAGATLRAITPLVRTRSDEQSVSFQFDKVGSPFGPPMLIPYHANFTVQMFLPQDAGWQMGEVGPLNEVH